MTSALIQLALPSEFQKTVTKDPDVSFWKTSFTPHANFELDFLKLKNLGESNTKQSFKVPKVVDLLDRVFVVFELPGLVNIQRTDIASKEGISLGSEWYELVEVESERQFLMKRNPGKQLAPGLQPYWCNSVGQHLIRNIRIRMQETGEVLSSMYSIFLKIWSQLSDKPERLYSQTYGKQTMTGTVEDRKRWSRRAQKIYVEIPFCFGRVQGHAMTTFLITNDVVRIDLQLNASLAGAILNKDPDTGFDTKTYVRAEQQAGASTIDVALGGEAGTKPVGFDDIKSSVWMRAVYVTPEEKKTYGGKHMQNIDTVAYRCFPLSYANAGINTIDLKKMTDRNVIEILVVVQHDSKHHQAAEPFSFGGPLDKSMEATPTIKHMQIFLNKCKRIEIEENPTGDFYSQFLPMMHHTNATEHIYMYSFTLKPEENQPTGMVNAKRLDSFTLQVQISARMVNPRLHVFLREFNILNYEKGACRILNK